ncbi:MAG: hypothetical protein ACI9KE_002865 [Polyangiales bacterium]|jgi:uncharacterized protein (TIGR02147 family)
MSILCLLCCVASIDAAGSRFSKATTQETVYTSIRLNLALSRDFGRIEPVSDAPDVFHYLDYRAYLRAEYEHRKAKGRGFSYRAFSRRAGLRSPNYLKLVTDGERSLTLEMAQRFAQALGLRGSTQTYFVTLVSFNQAENGEERNTHYATLTGFRKYRSAHKLDLVHAEYHSTWYLPAIRELAAREDFSSDPGWVARSLAPAITRQQAQRALELLVELELLVHDEDGKLVQGEALVSTGAEMQALHIANYHRMMLQRAAESIDLFRSESRDISSLTLCLGPHGLLRVKEKLRSFRQELLALEQADTQRQDVIQINMQLFPLSVVTEPSKVLSAPPRSKRDPGQAPRRKKPSKRDTSDS